MKIVRRLILINMILLMGIGCVACEIKKESEIGEEARIYNEAVDKFFEAVDNRDKESIVEMFSANVRDENPNISEQIDKLFDMYQGPTDICNRNGNKVRGEYSRGAGRRKSTIWSTFLLVSKEEYYWCYFKFVYENEEDEDEIGISSVSVYSADEFCKVEYSDEKIVDDRGLSVIIEDSLDCEVRAIGGSAYKYTNTGFVIDESSVKEFLEQSSSFSEFMKRFGEPNATNVYYCYEMEKKDDRPIYMKLAVDEDTDTIRSVSVNNDLEWLYLLWKNQ